MAIALPKYAVAADDVATQLYNHLRSTLASGYKITQHLSSKDLPVGTLFCLQQENRSLLVFICSDSSQSHDLSELDTKKILTHKTESLHKLVRFQHSLLPEKLHTHADVLAPLIVILPKGIEANTRLQLTSSGLRLFGHDVLTPPLFLNLVTQYIGISMSNYALEYMRSRFSPESTLSKNHSLHHTKNKSTPQLEQFLLSNEQEFALKQDLVLKADTDLPHKYNLRLVHGAAGSGKSLILLHRTKLLRELYPDKKILLLTHNKAINHYLRSRYEGLFQHQENECQPFMEWCLRQWKGTRRFVYEDEVMDVVVQMLERHFKGTSFTKNLFLREINFIKDRLIFTEANYLRVDRSGQAYSLNEVMRERLWRALLDFDTILNARHIMLWADLPRQLWRDTQEGKVTIEQYDHVLVDEAQYFAPIWFELIKKSIKPKTGQLFMVADPDQGFLNRHLSWKETGLDLRNRTFRLQKNYRSNPLILKVADEFRFNRIPDETDHMLAHKSLDGIPPSDCIAPTLLHFYHKKDEQNRLLSEIHKLLQQGTAARDILILDAGSFNVRPLLQTLKNTLGKPACILTDPYWNEDALRVCELNSATGIESPIVFITGLQALFNKEHRKGIGDRERHALALENTRKLYMGMTRASKKLVLLLTSDTIPQSLQIKEMAIPTTSPVSSLKKVSASVRYLHA
ncbi:MAG: UvrD-helicase domain-containing protein [Cocleimonas sp.]|nr:UvrD-helicase domain-containing protein [Cocleimonas sp.]